MGNLETDYLVIGSGAMGMAFVDTLLDETDADIIIVDNHHMAGGHWNDAYPFVRLHQPSAFYGVASMELGTRRLDSFGVNKGLFELASGPEVLAYFDRVMRERFLPSGRVRYFPSSRYLGDHRFASLLSDKEFKVDVRKRVVDSTWLNTSVPLTHKRPFDVAGDVDCIAPNFLPRGAQGRRQFVIIGGGKTAMDAAVWLLEKGAAPSSIDWVRPRESWLINRLTTQPSFQFFDSSIGGFARQMEAFAAASTVDDLFERLEVSGNMLRIDRSRMPEMMHYATISEGEIEALRKIERVHRAARITAIEPGRLRTTGGDIETLEDAIYIDCTARAANANPPEPVFSDGAIKLQVVRAPNPCLSAALAAHLEASFDDDAQRNRYSEPVHLSDTPKEWILSMLGNMRNQLAWSQEPSVSQWITDCRLDGFGKIIRDADKSDDRVAATLKRIRDNAMPAAANLARLAA